MSDLTIDEEEVGGVVVMAPHGRVDSTTAKSFETAALGVIENGAKQMVFDFAALDYISSAGLRVVLLSGKRLKAAGGALVLCNLQPAIRDVFEISGFLNLFEVRNSRDDALSHSA
ncbi:MAG: STAS domain-containing protein [Pseudomonadota bacterium]